MNRPFTAHSPYSLTPTEQIRSTRGDSPGAADDLHYDTADTTYDDFEDFVESDDDGAYDDYQDLEDLEDYDDYQPIDRRWMWVAGVAGAILLVAVICTVVILGGGDSGSVSSTTAPPLTTPQPAATTSAPPAAPTPSPSATLPPETVTTVTPTPSATASAPPVAPPIAAPPTDAMAPRTVTYRVFGNRPLLDLVTVIYTDQQGALQTELNVALPWTKTVVLDPGVELTSVTATSLTGQLNCSITDASGALITQQNSNSMITACTK
ncbi:MmpS family transport accessory protein [Mycobacterium sp. URHB0021]